MILNRIYYVYIRRGGAELHTHRSLLVGPKNTKFPVHCGYLATPILHKKNQPNIRSITLRADQRIQQPQISEN